MTDTASSPGDPMVAATAAAGEPRGRWSRHLATITTAYNLARQAEQMWRNYKNGRAYTISIPDRDELFDHVQASILARMDDSAQRALTARVRRATADDEFEAPIDRRRSAPRRVVLAYDGGRNQTIVLDGHDITVRVDSDDPVARGQGNGARMVRERSIVFTAHTIAARTAVVRFLQGIADGLSDDPKPRLNSAMPWGHWRVAEDIPVRALDSVVLPDGDLYRIVSDLRRFLDSEARYAELGVPWHRGYLFHGPPGTGKTSTASAVAGSFGLDVYYLSLSDLREDSSLAELLSGVPPRSLLLIEDVDVAHAATSRDDDRPGVTLAGLLNALDGMITPHGLVTVMTTNDRDVLDPALLRAGRVDVEVAMTYLTGEQTARLVARLLPGTRLPALLPNDLLLDGDWPRVTAAEIVGAVVSNLYDDDAALDAILTILTAGRDRRVPSAATATQREGGPS